jgi:nitrite reductase (NADH) large subunit
MRKRLLIVGNGMAGLRLVEEVLERAPRRFVITVIGAEPEPAYNRILLSALLAGEVAESDVRLKNRAWYARRGVKLITGDPASVLAPAHGAVALGSGASIPYDICVLATGSQPIRLSVPNAALDGVEVFRTIADTRMLQMQDAANPIVIGGGLLGIEAAYGLSRDGRRVTLIHLMDRLMERQLDDEAARLLCEALARRGIAVMLGAETKAFAGRARVEAVELRDGRTVACDLAVVAVGVRPAVQLAAAAGLALGRGILVDDKLESSVPGVFAIGECAEHRGVCYGLVEPAYEQARVLARRLAGEAAVYNGSVLATNLKVSGIPVFSVGDFEASSAEAIVFRDETAGVYRKLVVRDGRLVGAVLFGDTSDALWYRDIVFNRLPIADLRAALPFGKAHAEAA